MTGRNGNGGKGSGTDLREELTAELKHLRGAVRDVGEGFILRREGEIETLVACLSALPAGKLRAKAPEWLRLLSHLKLKPHKGRLKDLKEIDRMIELLMDGLMELHEGGKTKRAKDAAIARRKSLQDDQE